MGGFGIVAVDKLFGKCSDVGFEVGNWSAGLLLCGVGVLAMIARFVKSRVLSISALISAICWSNCAICFFYSAMIGSFTLILVKSVFSTFYNHFFFAF